MAFHSAESAVLRLLIVVVALLATHSAAQQQASTRLQVAFEWQRMDFAYATAEARQAAISDGSFVPANVIPVGLERHEQRLFVTLPRWKLGVPASLAYVDLANTSSKSPQLHPYPSWGAHSLLSNGPNLTVTTTTEIISPFRVRADRCHRLWVLDTGTADILGTEQRLAPTQLLVYDLHNDNLLRRFTLPAGQYKADSFFANIAVEVGSDAAADCADAYAYLADLGAPGLVVYSWRQQESWRVQHNYFHPDPLAGDYNIGGTRFQWEDGLFGVALSEAEDEAERRLYFHALSSMQEFSVPTQWLRNRTAATDGAAAMAAKVYRKHGSRGERGQAGAAFWADGVLFYTQPNRNALTCWRPADANATIGANSLGVVLESSDVMVFPNDVKVDADGGLWVLSDNLQLFTYAELPEDKVNFRILRGTVRGAVAGTTCAATGETAVRSTTEHDHRGHVHEQGHDEVQKTRARPASGRPNGGTAVVGAKALLAAAAVIVAVVCL